MATIPTELAVVCFVVSFESYWSYICDSMVLTTPSSHIGHTSEPVVLQLEVEGHHTKQCDTLNRFGALPLPVWCAAPGHLVLFLQFAKKNRYWEQDLFFGS